MKALIQKLTETFGPSGHEDAVREIIRAEVEPLADEVRVDALGSLIAVKCAAKPGGRKILLAAHMDEIGLIVTHVDANGFLRFTTLGGVYPRTLVGGRVRFLDGTPGIIGGEVLSDLSRLHTIEQLFIDTGAASRKDVKIKVGDVAAFDRPFLDLGGRIVAKSLDNRIGVAALIESLRQLKSTPNDAYFVFTTREELSGEAGAVTASFGIEPDLALAVDVTSPGDTPKGHKTDAALGKGPAIRIKDTGVLSDPQVVAWIDRTAHKNKLPVQRQVASLGTTDARGIQVSRAGVPVSCLAIPCRYIHTPSEMVDMGDVENTVKLLSALVSAPAAF